MSSATAGRFLPGFGFRTPMLWFLLAQMPAVFLYGFQSWSSAQFRTFPLLLCGIVWIAVSECAGRKERWRPESFLFILGNLLAFSLGAVRASAWLISVGAACGAFAWILARRRHVAGRVVFSMALLLLLLVRLPPSLSQSLENRWESTIGSLSNSVLIAGEVLHYTDSSGLHLEQAQLAHRFLHGGLAGGYSLVVLGLVMGTLMHRSVPHLLLLLPATLWCAVMTSVGGTVLGVYFFQWTGIDVSAGIAGAIWRLDLLLLGLAFVWSSDQAILVLTHAIPIMEEMVSGRRQIRRMEDDDDEMLERPMFRSNSVTKAFNAWVAPARPDRPLLAGVPEGAVVARARDTAQAGAATAVPAEDAADSSISDSLTVRGNSGPWLLITTAAVLMLLVQALRFLRI
ncbi:MAG TPA: hypothetical protein DCR20_01290 [Planctomycetaceae bacterium]|nr:hypothetical protein [Planctomycetaceae bacterium]